MELGLSIGSRQRTVPAISLPTNRFSLRPLCLQWPTHRELWGDALRLNLRRLQQLSLSQEAPLRWLAISFSNNGSWLDGSRWTLDHRTTFAHNLRDAMHDWKYRAISMWLYPWLNDRSVVMYLCGFSTDVPLLLLCNYPHVLIWKWAFDLVSGSAARCILVRRTCATEWADPYG